MDNRQGRRRHFSSTHLGVLAVAAAVTWLVLSWRSSVPAADLQLRREHIAAIDAEAASHEAAAARSRIANANLAGLEARAAALEASVLLSGSAAETIGQISAMATRARLRITRLAPAPLRPRPPFFEWTCTLAAMGTFRDVQAFFELAEELAPALRIDGFTVRRAAHGVGGLLSLDVVFTALTAANAKARAVNPGNAPVQKHPGSARRVGDDPFAAVAAETPVAMTAGLQGISIADVTLQGVLTSNGQATALLRVPDRRTYLARTGTELRDGWIKGIGRGSVTFAAGTEGEAVKEVVVALSRARR